MSFPSSPDRDPSEPRPKQVVVVEDLQGHWMDIQSDLTGAFPTINAPQRFSTEESFRAYLRALTPDETPDLFVVDMMLRWTDPRPDLEPPPDDVFIGGYQEAGLRCVRDILANEHTRLTPIIIHTILTREDINEMLKGSTAPLDTLPPHVKYSHKGADGSMLVSLAQPHLSGHR